MDGVAELAMKIKSLESELYSPMIGRIISLPDLTIQLGDKVQLSVDDISATFEIYETKEHDGRTEYIHLNKQIVLLPCYAENGRVTRFIAIGVIA